MATRNVPATEIKLLWSLSAGQCAFAGCRAPCTQPGTKADSAKPIGEMAHIVAYSNAGPRGDPSVKEEDRNLYPNLILLCATHHTVVDKQANSYTVADLKRWKLEHEQWVVGRLSSTMITVGFEELEEVCRHLLAGTATVGADLTLVAPKDKIMRNSLSPATTGYVNMGLTRVDEVAKFLKMKEKIDAGYANRLAARFIAKYEGEKGGLSSPDAIFQALWEFASPGGSPQTQAAGLSVLTYLFERCEVFEK